MATVNFLYRSTKTKSYLNIRLLYRYDDKDYVIGARTKLMIDKLFWTKQRNKKTRDIDIINLQTTTNSELNRIENHVLSAFHTIDAANEIDNQWLKEQLEAYYYPKHNKIVLPTKLNKYFDVVIKEKEKELAKSSIKSFGAVKNMLSRYEENQKITIQIKGVNNDFRNSFYDYCKEQQYAQNTIAKALKTIKTVCFHAKYNGLEVSLQLNSVKAKTEKAINIHFTIKELEELENIKKEKLTESLESVRDWILISCYTGQRISDFMRFDKKMIREEDGKLLIEFTQAKTKKDMTIPLHKKIQKILKKRKGEFPRAISDVKYNKYMKDVCQIAEINKEIRGSKREDQEDIDSKFSYRKSVGEYEKWELVSSHIGRRTFATNNYGIIPTSFLIYVTGHSTETEFRKYIGKSSQDIAKELTKYF